MIRKKKKNITVIHFKPKAKIKKKKKKKRRRQKEKRERRIFAKKYLKNFSNYNETQTATGISTLADTILTGLF